MTCLWRSGSHFPTTPGIPQWFNNQSKYAGMMEVAHELSIMKFIHQWWSGYGYFNTACLPVISSSDQHKVPIVVSFLGMISQASGGRLIILNHFCNKKTGFFFSEVDIYSVVKAMVFPVVMCGYESQTLRLNTKELMLLNCGAGEDSWESLGQQGDQSSQF